MLQEKLTHTFENITTDTEEYSISCRSAVFINKGTTKISFNNVEVLSPDETISMGGFKTVDINENLRISFETGVGKLLVIKELYISEIIEVDEITETIQDVDF